MSNQYPIQAPPGHPRRWPFLTGPILAAGLTLAGLLARGGPVTQATAAEAATPPAGHAQVIAQAVVDLADGNLVWTVAAVDAGEQLADLGNSGAPGFVLGTEGAVMVRAAGGARTRLAGGEALTVRPDDVLTVQAVGEEQTSVSLLTLDRAAPNGVDDAARAGETFASPGGSRDVDLVGDVLVEGETTELATGAAPIFVLVMAGAVTIDVAGDEAQVVQAGKTALVPGDLVLTGASAEPARFVTAVIGADVNAEREAGNATSEDRTPSQPTPTGAASSPTPAASPSPSPSPTTIPPAPTPDGNGPDDDPDSDGLVNKLEEFYGTEPRNPDTDGDRLMDGDEVNVYGSHATIADTDGDGLSDGDEVLVYGTGFDLIDTDADGLTDVDEIALGINPLAPDSDGDSLGDREEIFDYVTSPVSPDTDGDGLNDQYEISGYPTDPRNPDTDGDGFTDGQEVYDYGTHPNDPNDHP